MGQANFTNVRVCYNVTEEEFRWIVRADEPVLLKNCDFGECMSKWNLAYLTDKLGDQEIKIHEFCNQDLGISNAPPYKECQFKYLSRRLRQLSSPDTPSSNVKINQPSTSSRGSLMRNSLHFSTANGTEGLKDPTKIEDVFPSLRKDLKLPSFLPLGKDKQFYDSSVLRIVSKDVVPLTDFDPLPFVLCQVVGLNCVLLWPRHEDTKPWACVLHPGDCLFIPMLWRFRIRTAGRELLDQIPGYDEMPKGTDPKLDYSIAFSVYWIDPFSFAVRRQGMESIAIQSFLGLLEEEELGAFRFRPKLG